MPGKGLTTAIQTLRLVGNATVSNIGGLVGRHGGNADTDVINSYWNSQTSGQNASAGGTGEMTRELQEPTTATSIYARLEYHDNACLGFRFYRAISASQIWQRCRREQPGVL